MSGRRWTAVAAAIVMGWSTVFATDAPVRGASPSPNPSSWSVSLDDGRVAAWLTSATSGDEVTLALESRTAPTDIEGGGLGPRLLEAFGVGSYSQDVNWFSGPGPSFECFDEEGPFCSTRNRWALIPGESRAFLLAHAPDRAGESYLQVLQGTRSVLFDISVVAVGAALNLLDCAGEVGAKVVYDVAVKVSPEARNLELALERHDLAAAKNEMASMIERAMTILVDGIVGVTVCQIVSTFLLEVKILLTAAKTIAPLIYVVGNLLASNSAYVTVRYGANGETAGPTPTPPPGSTPTPPPGSTPTPPPGSTPTPSPTQPSIPAVPVGSVDLGDHDATTVHAGTKAVWIGDLDAGQVLRVNPATRRATAVIDVGGEPWAITEGAGSAWVLVSCAGVFSCPAHIARIDLDSNSIVSTIDSRSLSVEWVLFAHGSLWAADYSDTSTIYRFNPANGQVESTISVQPRTEGALSTGGGVWVRSQGDGFAEIDASTNAVTKAVPAVAGVTVYGFAFDGAGQLWISGCDANGQVVASVNSSTAALIREGHLSSTCGVPKISYHRGWLWVADPLWSGIEMVDPATAGSHAYLAEYRLVIDSGATGMWAASFGKAFLVAQ